MKNEIRNSSIELLRIIAMLMIVFHHFIVHGVLNHMYTIKYISRTICENTIVSQIIASGGKVGVDLFILVTSYFLVNLDVNLVKQKIKLKKLAIPVQFYSILFLCIAILLHEQINFNSLIKSIFPILFINYWFITDYIILYIFAPFINKMISNLNRKQHLLLTILLILYTSFLPTFLPGSLGTIDASLLFLSLYITGAYIRKYSIKNESKLGLKLMVGSTIALILSYLILNLLAYKFKNLNLFMHTGHFSSGYSIIIYLIALGLFLWGKNWNLKPSKVINGIAATTLGVYLIHDNPFIRNIIWIDLLHLPKLIDGSWINIIIQAVIICPVYFLICSGIEFIRQKLFAKMKF